MESLQIDKTKLITQSEYAKLKALSKQRVNQLVKSGEIKSVKIKGATLVLMD